MPALFVAGCGLRAPAATETQRPNGTVDGGPVTRRQSAEPGATIIPRFSAGDGAGLGHVRPVLLTCQSGFEALLARELTELHALEVMEKGPGWVRITGQCGRGAPTPQYSLTTSVAPSENTPSSNPQGEGTPPTLRSFALESLAFAHLTLVDLIEVRGESVNALANQIASSFLERIRGERIEGSWPSVWLGPHEIIGLGRRVSAAESAFSELLKKKLARVAKLATTDTPRAIGSARGLFVLFADFGRAFVARDAYVHGPRRMADDPLAPSRSYLKVEEAYVVLGREPKAGDTVCDLGAAPGGWSYSAAKRGARVVAVDNGPLKGGALDNPNIEHRREDAFRFAPPSNAAFDWLFCDLVEDPHHVLRDILLPWITRGWCHRFIVNLKFGRVDPIALLRELHAPGTGLASRVGQFRIRHLYHDREEFTLVGELPGR